MPDARDLAVSALGAWRRDGAWSDEILRSNKQINQLIPADRALVSRIIYGVQQKLYLIDWYIGEFSSIRLKKITPKILDIFRVATYQILFLDRVPDRAAVDCAVNQAKHDNPRAAAFVNAVLRAMSAHHAQKKIPENDTVKYLSLTESMPEWLVKRFINILGIDGAKAFFSACNEPAPLYARVNTLRGNMDELKGELEKDGVVFSEVFGYDNFLILANTGDITQLSAYQKGLFTVQDPAAWLSVNAASPAGGEVVIDTCSAPGGKSFAAAEMMGNHGTVKAFDLYPNKLEDIDLGAERLGADIILTAPLDASIFTPPLKESADLVIADVPCSGFGVIRKKPDIRYRDEADAAKMPELQLKIVSNVSAYVKPGGRLLYSTCTLMPEENGGVVAEFLKTHPAFHSVDERTLMPHIDGTDGFYYCLMKRD